MPPATRDGDHHVLNGTAASASAAAGPRFMSPTTIAEGRKAGLPIRCAAFRYGRRRRATNELDAVLLPGLLDA